jgi:uncharacterized DUF497 family protein
MGITFDPSKDASNIEKHRVSLAEASGFEWNEAVSWLDQRHGYGERA